MNPEELVTFGPDGKLLGVLSGQPTHARPTLVLLNAGTFPRTGPFRLHVDLARRLVARGVAVFRFDMPGIGESPMLACNPHEALAAALDCLEGFGARQFIVGGICSAADMAWRASERDQRVAGLLLLDPLSYTGPWFWLAKARQLLGKPAAQWPGAVLRFISARNGRTREAPQAADFRDWPSREEARAHLSQLVSRKVRLMVVYTGSAADRFLDPRQFAWAFGRAARNDEVSVHHWPGCDHLFYLRAYRQQLIRTVERWLLPG